MGKAVVVILLIALGLGVVIVAGFAAFVFSIGTKLSSLDIEGTILRPDGAAIAAAAIAVYSPIQGCAYTYAERRTTDEQGGFSVRFTETFSTSLLDRKTRAPRPVAFGFSIPGHSEDEMYIVSMPPSGAFVVRSCGLRDGYARSEVAKPLSVTGDLEEVEAGWRVRVRVELPTPARE